MAIPESREPSLPRLHPFDKKNKHRCALEVCPHTAAAAFPLAGRHVGSYTARVKFAVASLIALALAHLAFAELNWPQFRGPGGVADVPSEFGPEKNVVWKAPLASGHSSPVLWGGRIFLTTFEDGKLFAVCLDRVSGRTLWSREVPAEKIEEVHRIGSPAAATPCTDGERVYHYFGSFGLLAQLSLAEIPRGPLRDRFSQLDAHKDGHVSRAEWEAYAPVVAKAENALFAVRPGGRGDITASHVVWKKTRGLPYVPSPLFYEGRIYTVKSGGMASCFDAGTGQELWLEQRAGILGDFYASPVAAAGKIYVAAQNGTVAVLAAGDTFKVLAKNVMGEPIFATPAMADGRIYLRTAGHLYCLGSATSP